MWQVTRNGLEMNEGRGTTYPTKAAAEECIREMQARLTDSASVSKQQWAEAIATPVVYSTVVVLDKPDGTRLVFEADTPGIIQYGCPCWLRTSIGWDGKDDSPGHPCPGHVLRVVGTASVRGPFDDPLAAAPWIWYVTAVPK